jgi:hypothetical protein
MKARRWQAFVARANFNSPANARLQRAPVFTVVSERHLCSKQKN